MDQCENYYGGNGGQCLLIDNECYIDDCPFQAAFIKHILEHSPERDGNAADDLEKKINL